MIDKALLKQEIESLRKLPKALSCKRRVIITYDEEKTIEDEYGVIEVIPCWKWLIQLSQQHKE